MGDESIQVCPTCVRVPVANCHSESILVETERKITVDEGAASCSRPRRASWSVDDLARQAISDAQQLRWSRRSLHRPHPRRPVESDRAGVLVCQRQCAQRSATNAVQIAELLAQRHAASRRHTDDPHRRRVTEQWGARRLGFELAVRCRLRAMWTIKLTLSCTMAPPDRGWQMQAGEATLQQRSERAVAPHHGQIGELAARGERTH